jgi:hypothetical protein
MDNKELLYSEGFQKFSKALGTIFYIQINALSDLYKKKIWIYMKLSEEIG